MLIAQQQDLQIQIKNLQREAYFISLERKRKLGVRQKLKDEIDEEKKRALLKKTIEAKIKKEVHLYFLPYPYINSFIYCFYIINFVLFVRG